MTRKIFCSAVNYNIRTKIQRILKIGRHKGIVNNQKK